MSRMLDVARNAYLALRGRSAKVQETQRQPASAAQMMRGQLAPSRMIKVHKEKVWALAFFKDGRRVITSSHDATLQIWDVQKGALVGGPFEGHKHGVKSVAISPDDRRIASGGNDKTIIIWDVESKQMVFGIDPLVKHTDSVCSVCFSPNGKKLASGSNDKTVVIWDMETGEVLATLEGHSEGVYSVAFSPDGLKIASGSEDRTIRVWRTDTSALLLQFDAHEHRVRSVVWSPDGFQLVSASYDSTVKFWNSHNGNQIGQPCIGHSDWIYSLAISSDGSFIATASDDQTVRLWSTKTHKQIGQALKHTELLYCVALSPNGELLVSGDGEGKVQLWPIESARSLAIQLCSSCDSFFAHRSKVKLGQNLYPEALHDAEKVVELDPSSYRGYELKHAALRGVQRYDDAIEAFKVMLFKLDDAPYAQVQKLRRKYVSPSEAEDAIRRAIHAQLDNAPLRLLNTFTGRLCNREAQINAFVESTEYKELLYSSMTHAPLQTEPITEAVAKYFSWVMLSHRWERKELLLDDIQEKDVYSLDPVGNVVKLQKFCEIARDAGSHWAWSNACCIDQNNNVELQESVNSMFVWYHDSALTIVYLSDVPPSSNYGALANSTWNTRGWTLPELLAPKNILFYQADWTPYLDDHSRNHKESVAIIQELEDSTGIDARALVAFHPGMRTAREKLRWAATRVTTVEEDVAYSLFGIFGVHLPVIYGETKQNALGRLLQATIAHSGDITALEWVGKSSEFNSYLPADIASYKAPPCTPPSLSQDEMQTSVSKLRNVVAVESASKLYTLLDNLSTPHFAYSRLQLPCIVFPVTEVRRRRGQDRESCFTYEVKADGLEDLLITTEDKLIQFSPARPPRQTVLLIRPWNHHDFGLPDLTDETQNMDDSSEPKPSSDNSFSRSSGEYSETVDSEFSSDDSLSGSSGEYGSVDSESYSRALRLMVRLGQPFGALFLAQQRGGEYKRIASDRSIIARVRDMTSVDGMTDVRTLEIS
ncbi:uncharacterized protein EDB91DRAFT_386645 [Suillus paluster]|uniref:uncharacterized protein n=1 Tax=Suillus paluster TaxID=48578 RepID=UPI001B884BEE|nr:uncharacterized protein EDB91DRAFT_386645 [Suillus paluster]KAG1739462.1 hypothetical protein EDB91DRAFT_386645 [Suillus paluster]